MSEYDLIRWITSRDEMKALFSKRWLSMMMMRSIFREAIVERGPLGWHTEWMQQAFGFARQMRENRWVRHNVVNTTAPRGESRCRGNRLWAINSAYSEGYTEEKRLCARTSNRPRPNIYIANAKATGTDKIATATVALLITLLVNCTRRYKQKSAHARADDPATKD